MADTTGDLDTIATYIAVRKVLLRRAIGWGLLFAVTGLLTLGMYFSAQSAATDPYASDQDRTYFVLWGPMLFGAWRSGQALLSLRRVNRMLRPFG